MGGFDQKSRAAGAKILVFEIYKGSPLCKNPGINFHPGINFAAGLALASRSMYAEPKFYRFPNGLIIGRRGGSGLIIDARCLMSDY